MNELRRFSDVSSFFLEVTPILDKITKPFFLSTKIILKVEGSKIKKFGYEKNILSTNFPYLMSEVEILKFLV